jgi:hypothetical protein
MAKIMKGKLPTNEILGIIAGSVAAGFAAKAVNQFLPTAPAPVKNLIPVGLGVFLAMQKNPLVKGAGFGMIAKGSAGIVEAFGLGQPNVDELFLSASDEDFLSIPADQSILSAPADQSILSAFDDDGISEMDELSMMSAYDEEF